MASAAHSSDSNSPAKAELLVAEAIEAAMAGDATRRATLLDQAVAVAPDCSLARWHRGEIAADGEWQPVQEIAAAAAADPLQAEYRRLRESTSSALAAQLELAQWCRRNKLDDEAWFHWANVVSMQPDNKQALRALGMRWHANRLMTHAEFDRAKRRVREARQAAKRWAPQVTHWQRALTGDLAEREQAQAEIRALDDPDAIPALEEAALDANPTNDLDIVRCRQISRALIDALSAMRDQQATVSLIRHALYAPIGDVRNAAIAGLRERPLHDYVPLLLDDLAMPIESSFRVANDGDGSVHYWHTLYREGRHANHSFEGRLSAMQHDLQGPTDVTLINAGEEATTRYAAPTDPTLIAEMARVERVNRRRFGSRAISVEQDLKRINQAVADSNGRIIELLVTTVGKDLGESPRFWWEWWDQYNEYYAEGEPPEYGTRFADQTHRYYRPRKHQAYDITPLPPQPKRSCFAAGTLVWTKTGRRAIETLEIGDLVLAQDVDTGELAYKPVLGRTVRPATETVNLSINGDQLQTTLGHPIWVAGIGWQMAKQLEEDAVLFGVDGPIAVDAIESAGEAEAYNLIVADFNTYFVGQSGVLVHDNTPRQPTAATVPGLVASSTR